MEIWKKIEDYPNYEVSSHGRIRNIQTDKVLSSEISSTGYPSIRIFNKEGKRKHLNIHVLVAKAFLEPVSECVNHKDGDKTNNKVENLEWCTYSHNNQHAYDNHLKKARGLNSEEARKMREKVDITKNYVPVIDMTTKKTYKSISSTKEDGFNPNLVQQVCAGQKKTHKGHIFSYAERRKEA